MIDRDELAPAAEHPKGFLGRATIVRDRAEGEGDQDRVETGVLEVERLRVAEAQVDVGAQLFPTSLRQGEHLRAQLDRRHPNVRRIQRNVAARTDRDLQYLAFRLRAGPLSRSGKQQTLEEAHLAVVARGMLVLDLSNAVRFVVDVSAHPAPPWPRVREPATSWCGTHRGNRSSRG